MLIRYGFDITIACAEPTPIITVLRVREERQATGAASSAARPGPEGAAESYHTVPDVPSTLYRDGFGNTCRRFVAPIGDLQLWGDGTVHDSGLRDRIDADARETPVPDLPDETLVFLLGSRYCETDRLSQTAWDLFGHLPPGWSRVQAICDFVHNHIAFDYQNANSWRSAHDAYLVRTGVCRDFAHLAIALIRCMNIPARYVNGYLTDIGVPIISPMDFSAWVEVFLDGEWRTFDPRNNIPRIGRIVIARGRDAADVPLINSFGPHLLKGFRVWAYEVN